MRKAPRTMVISLQKTGTHLMQGLMVELGYKMAGVPRPEPSNIPRFTDEDRSRIAALVLSEPDYKELLGLRDREEFIHRTDEAWSALSWNWQRRLGQRVVNRYGQARYDFADHVITNEHISYSRFADTPPGLCWIFHELDLSRVDGNFIAEWVETGTPPFIFNYRDPRDALVSLINFLEGRTRQGYGNFYEYDLFSAILKSKSTWEEKIDYALQDRSFIGQGEFERSLWLLHHPNVCKLRYEDLVGPRGGGSRKQQVDAVGRLLRHIGDETDPQVVVDKIYNPNSWSFFKGSTGSWRDVFSKRNEDRFRERYGDILEQYGYE
jgi:hypothetical protein